MALRAVAMPFNVFDLLGRVRRRSPKIANRLMDRLLTQLIPLVRGLDVRVLELNDLRCVLSMPLRKRTRNHVGSMYFGAQMTLADLTVGALAFSRFPPGPFGGLIKRVEADFLVKAKGTIRCVCEPPLEVLDALERVRDDPSGRSEAWVPLSLLDRDDQVVTKVRFLVALKRFD